MQQREDCRFLLVKAVWVIIPHRANSAELLHSVKKKSEAEI